MDNITHTLLGAVLSELAVPKGATASTRRLFLAAGVIASNAPDLDLLYVGITPFPLGYLLHHRGHTHTVIGLIAQAVLLALACQLVMPWLGRRTGGRRAAASDAARPPASLARAPTPNETAMRTSEAPAPWRARLWTLIAVALVSHVALDACNSYGVHPFSPLSSRWYFGDALFIFEPWLWLVLGLMVGLNARRLTRLLLIALLAMLLVALAIVSVMTMTTLVALIVVAIALGWWARPWAPRTRAALAVAATALFVAGMFVLSGMARTETRALLAAETRGVLLDLALTPNPAAPACWSVIAVERDDADGTFVVRRGTFSLWPSWRSPVNCASHRLAGSRDARRIGDGRLVWSDEIRQPLTRLRALGERDCWVAAWLQFGRAPVLREDQIFDLRFENGTGGNFTAMSLRRSADAGRCPANVTNWTMPRADLLTVD